MFALEVPEMITIRFAGWISGKIVSLQPDTDMAKTAFKREQDTDPDIRNAFIDNSRIQTSGKSCTLHNYSFIIFRSIFSAVCAMTPNQSLVQSLYRSVISFPSKSATWTRQIC